MSDDAAAGFVEIMNTVRADAQERGLAPAEAHIAICRGQPGCVSDGGGPCPACYRVALDDPRTPEAIYAALRKGDA